MSDDEAAVYLSLAMGMIEIVKSHEEDAKPKGARTVALRNFYDSTGKIICSGWCRGPWKSNLSQAACWMMWKRLYHGRLAQSW